MRVCIANQYALPTSQPGIQRHSGLGRALVELGNEVTVVCSDVSYLTRKRYTESRSLEENGVRFEFVRSLEFEENGLARARNVTHYARAQTRRFQELASQGFDVIMGSSPSPFAAASAFRAARRMDVPFVYEVRDPWPLILRDIGGMPAAHPLVVASGSIERKLLKRADALVSLYPGYVEHVVGRGFPREKTHFVPNGVRVEDRAISPLPNNDPYVFVYTGAHGVANDLGRMLDGLGWLRDNRPEIYAKVRVRLVGSGGEKAKLIERAQAEKIDAVEFLDPVTREEAMEHIVAADACVLCLQPAPSLKLGPSPNKLFDYLVVGRPVIYVADTNPDPVRDGECGVSVVERSPEAVGKAMAEMVEADDDRRRAWAANARAYVEEHHSNTRLAQRLAEVLAGVAR